MKRYLMAALSAAVLCLALAGCTGSGIDWLSYRDGFVSAEVSDGMRTWQITPVPDGFTAEILTPPEAAGVSFRVTGTSASVFAGETEIPVSGALAANVRQMTQCFAQGEARILSVHSFGSTDDVRVRFVIGDGAEISAVFGADGLPVSFETENGVYTVEKLTVNGR